MDEFDRTVLHFMDEFGTTALYIRQVDGEYNPTTGTVQSTEVKFPVRGILMEYTLQSNGLKNRYGTDILAGDKQFFMQPPGKNKLPSYPIDPTKDKLQVGPVLYNIVTSKEVNPTGVEPILYELLLRR